MSGYKTINTFTRMPSAAQIVSYLVISLETCIFYIMVRPNIYDFVPKTTLTVLFTISISITIISTLICSYTDPSDTIMIHCKNQQKTKIKVSQSELLYCDYCKTFVTPGSRHCRECDRCTQNFDHHCMWINNCIGSKNYKIFILMITSTLCNLSIFISSVVVLSVENNWANFRGLMITNWITLSVVFILFILLLNLNLLHIYLICKGYTTYEFIMARKQQQRVSKLKQKQKQAQQRTHLETINSKRNVKHEAHTQHKICDKQMRPVIQNKQKQQQQHTNAQINLTPKNNQTDKKEHEYDENKKQANVFGSSSQKYDKSEYQSVQIANEQDLKASRNRKGYSQNDNQEEKLQSSQGNSSIKISQFFIRNKSFNFLISNQKVQKPHKTTQDIPLDETFPQKQSNQKQNKSLSNQDSSFSKLSKNKTFAKISKS